MKLAARAVAGLALGIGIAFPSLAQDRPFVEDAFDATGARSAPVAAAPLGGSAGSATSCITLTDQASTGMPLPSGGTLAPGASSTDPATIDAGGRMAFNSGISGAASAHGVFSADDTGLTEIALGCGGLGGGGTGGGGCGSPTPLGGTYGGMFSGTWFAPAINDVGDVLFLAEVENGSSPRALFLYHETTGVTEVVAAIGDPSPLGGTITSVGPGTVNNAGVVAFLAVSNGPSTLSDVLLWNAGSLSKVAAAGDAAPGGGIFTSVGSEAFIPPDGLAIPVGRVPDINDAGQVTFRALLSGGLSNAGIFVSSGGVHQWYVAGGDATPDGGTFIDFQAAMINEAGEIAFSADYWLTPTTLSFGWFAGTPGNWRKALAWYDPMEGGTQCWGLSFARNPMRALDESGNVLLKATARYPDTSLEERLVVSERDGNVHTIIAQGDPVPTGGSVVFIQSWPSMNANAQATVSVQAGGAQRHFLGSDVLTWQDLGYSLAGVSGPPKLTGSGTLEPGSPGMLELTNAAPGAAALLVYGLSQVNLPLFGGTLVPSRDYTPIALTTDGVGAAKVPWAAWPALPPCVEYYAQAWIMDAAGPFGWSASNGLKATTR